MGFLLIGVILGSLYSRGGLQVNIRQDFSGNVQSRTGACAEKERDPKRGIAIDRHGLATSTCAGQHQPAQTIAAGAGLAVVRIREMHERSHVARGVIPATRRGH